MHAPRLLYSIRVQRLVSTAQTVFLLERGQTKRLTDATECPIHTSSYTAGVGNNISEQCSAHQHHSDLRFQLPRLVSTLWTPSSTCSKKYLWQWVALFTMRCYANAVYAVIACLSVCPSFTSRCSMHRPKSRITLTYHMLLYYQVFSVMVTKGIDSWNTAYIHSWFSIR